MHITPSKITDNIIKIYNNIGGYSIQFIEVEPEINCIEFDCHNNCSNSEYPRVLGFYVVMDLNVGCYNLVKHSVIRKDNKLIDITPSNVKRILFIETGFNTSFNFRFYSFLGEYLYMNYSVVKNLPETIENYYVYGLVDPRTEKVFYVGKGKKNRWSEHIKKRNLTDNSHKSNVINKILNEGLQVGVIFLEKNIKDEAEAYNLEEKHIKSLGRNRDGGSLTNVCLDGNPPNHRGKTYEDIYGFEKAKHQKEIRRNLQIEAGGWFGGKTHSIESKSKISKESTGIKNGNSNGLTEKDYLSLGKEFCELFNFKISKSKWEFFCKTKNISVILRSFRFKRKYILEVFKENFNAEIEWEKQMWFNDGKTQIRLSEWKIKETGIPNGFIKGRL